MQTLQILTILVLFVIVVISVIVGTRAHQKERETTERRFKHMQLLNRADRVHHHIVGVKPINTDSIVTNVLFDFYIETLHELLNYTDHPDDIEMRIAKAEEERNQELIEFTTTPALLSFSEKAKFKERLTKVAKLLLYLRRKGRISNTHYKACYDYLRWINLWLQLNRQVNQANNNFNNGDMRVAQTLYGVIMSHLRSATVDRPEKQIAINYVNDQMKAILAPKLVAIQNAENPEAALADLIIDFDETAVSDADLIDENKG